jgi:hypothetical protein
MDFFKLTNQSTKLCFVICGLRNKLESEYGWTFATLGQSLPDFQNLHHKCGFVTNLKINVRSEHKGIPKLVNYEILKPFCYHEY